MFYFGFFKRLLCRELTFCLNSYIEKCLFMCHTSLSSLYFVNTSTLNSIHQTSSSHLYTHTHAHIHILHTHSLAHLHIESITPHSTSMYSPFHKIFSVPLLNTDKLKLSIVQLHPNKLHFTMTVQSVDIFCIRIGLAYKMKQHLLIVTLGVNIYSLSYG